MEEIGLQELREEIERNRQHQRWEDNLSADGFSLIPYYILNAFTDHPYAGNPAGVFFDDEGILSAEQMRRMAGEIGLESAFVTPAELGSGADFRLRYFTGVTEVPFCGHDTVSVPIALAHTRRIKATAETGGDAPLTLRFQTSVGIIAVDFREKGGLVTLHQNAPEFSPPLDAAQRERIAAALGVSSGELVSDLPVQRVSTGTPWLIVPIANRKIVDAVTPDFAEITRISRETDTFGLYIFARDTEMQAQDNDGKLYIWSRCFAPIAGIEEDPVTGSASGALGGYLAAYGLLKTKETAVSQQGFGGGREGVAETSIARNTQGAIEGVDVTGEAVLIAEGSIVAPATA